MDHLSGAHMCFITAGMGGGTGTGAAPIIAQAAREMGILTVGVVTKPFAFEGAKRMRQAENGVEELQKVVDTLIIIPNQNLFRLANERTTFTEAFSLADDVLYQGVKGVTDLMVRPGMINLDFADVRAVMDEMGKAMMGTGEAAGEDRARQAAEKAIANPLLDEISLNGAKGVLINITGGHDLTLFELDEAANLIRNKVDPEANIIVGSTLDPEMEGAIRVSVVATGIEAQPVTAEVPRRRLAEPLLVEQPAPEPAPEPVYEAEQQDHGYDNNGYQSYEAAEAPAQYDDSFEYEHEPQQAAQPAPQRYDAPETYAQHNEPVYREPRPEMRHEPRTEHRTEHRAEPRPEMRAAPQPEPVQEDFFLEDVLGDETRQPARRGVNRAPEMVQPAPQPESYGRQPRTAGEPSPETLQRLQKAVSKQPERPAAAHRAPTPVRQQPAPQPEQRRGLGGLIHRMAGVGHGGGTRQEAPVSGNRAVRHDYEDEAQQHSQDQIEIPAFLRRQAN